ncbi:MAG: bifunctional homocysteine S-methyltransferase/methylenetetrahydrofolate reductase [Armatimonadota bacterium]|nr:bifunctional homocysteine S-methyltransferase/methylenetetrahydrofolate reductase [bacterium]MDW8321434.1 bifunctional homocysteine S-methyltransferase/methylenetetrahydrofolate reductase [Armatimonadota bacterium]
MKRERLLQILQEGVLIADGAMGTMLQRLDVQAPYELANLAQPDAVRQVHRSYIEAGARLIETNTFGANRVKLATHGAGHLVREINLAAVKLAREAAGDLPVIVAGAVGPVGKPLAPIGQIAPQEAGEAFREQIAVLLEAGVDVILLETFTHLDELGIALEQLRALDSEMPVIAQKAFIEDGETLASGLPAQVARTLQEWGVDVIGANCVVGPQRMVGIMQAMASATGLPLSVMPTPGLPQYQRGEVAFEAQPDYFAQYGEQFARTGVNIIGGCCGTTPAHIRAVAQRLQGVKPRLRRAPAKAVEAVKPEELPRAEPSQLAGKLGKKYVIAVELDLPRGLDVAKVLEGARSLKERGVDVIDISDGARARLRMNPIAISHLIQEQVGIEVMMHFACRDRNLLAIQADLLGAHALGIRNILAVTGDPALIGDYPTATSVFDIDSVGLVRILRRFNEGVDLAGNSIGVRTAFTIAVAYNPLAYDQRVEDERLKRKAAEGAHLVYTQPIFDILVLEKAVGAASKAGLPLLVGVLPLRSSRHAEFMHHEVPGVQIPDAIRKRLAELEEGDARKYGLEVAREFTLRARTITQGVYLMPPFGNHKVAEAVIEVLTE